MLPILISVSVAPGLYCFCAVAGLVSNRTTPVVSIASGRRFIVSSLQRTVSAMLEQAGPPHQLCAPRPRPSSDRFGEQATASGETIGSLGRAVSNAPTRRFDQAQNSMAPALVTCPILAAKPLDARDTHDQGHTCEPVDGRQTSRHRLRSLASGTYRGPPCRHRLSFRSGDADERVRSVPADACGNGHPGE